MSRKEFIVKMANDDLMLYFEAVVEKVAKNNSSCGESFLRDCENYKIAKMEIMRRMKKEIWVG